MNKRRVDTDVNEKRMLTRQEAANYLGVGLRAAREFCDSCHATRPSSRYGDARKIKETVRMSDLFVKEDARWH